MTDEEEDRLRYVITKFGFVVPLVVRPHPDDDALFEIIDGEHRLDVGTELGIQIFPCRVIDVDTDTAMQLTPILNELHGTADSEKLGALLKDLATRQSEVELRAVMPFARERFDELIGAITVDWGALENQRAKLGDNEERWVERVFRMPAEAAEVVDQAIDKAKGEADASNDWQGLEFIAAEFMGR